MKKITRNDWNIKNMPNENVKFEFYRIFTEIDIEILRLGFKPKEMEDKWFCFMEDDVLFLHRSWTGVCVFIVEFYFVNNIHKVIANRDNIEVKFLEVDYLKNLLNRVINYLIFNIRIENKIFKKNR